MGRRRKKNLHLPVGMQLISGTYWYARGKDKWVRLGREFGPALVKYAGIVGAKPEVRTVQHAIAHYIEWATTRRKPIKPATLEGYKNSSKNLIPVFGHLELADIEPQHVYQYLIERGDVQANRDRSLLSATFTHARRIGAFKGDDPTKGLEYRNDESPRQRYIEDGELAVLLNAASAKLSCILNFSYLTGLRQSDVVKVKLADITAEGIRAVTNKTDAPVTIEWSDELRACVAEANRLWTRAGRIFLFESMPKGKHAKRGPGPYTTSGLRSLWRTARNKTSVKNVRLNDLRRKAGSDKETDQEAADLLTHKDTKVTRRHYRAKPKKAQPAR